MIIHLAWDGFKLTIKIGDIIFIFPILKISIIYDIQ